MTKNYFKKLSHNSELFYRYINQCQSTRNYLICMQINKN